MLGHLFHFLSVHLAFLSVFRPLNTPPEEQIFYLGVSLISIASFLQKHVTPVAYSECSISGIELVASGR